ncbi:MAG: tRNA (guanosine(37)-N1)-methyltransferase TrmD [bacterium]|nr:tRNA (guanosine(37)-N1)-methyltransferase TrmD [bacterium]
MLITVLTLFPEMFKGPLDYSIIKRARNQKLLRLNLLNIRDFAEDRHKTVDDRPYGGGSGMIFKVDVIDRALKKATSYQPQATSKKRVVLLDPQGKTYTQKNAKRLSKFGHLILVCGHYEGVDERVRKLVDEEISIGDYVLTGGEIPAMVIIDSVTRLLPGVLTKEEATRLESFSPYAMRHTPLALPTSRLHPKHSALLEYPQYTRPPVYRKWKVPQILLSGNHEKIEKWRRDQAGRRTKKHRPDLLT